MKNRDSVILLLLIALVCALRFYRINYDNIWLDESFDLRYACGPSLSESLNGALHGCHFPLHIFCLFFWLRIFNNLLMSARFLHAVIGITAVVSFFWFCRVVDVKKRPLFPHTGALLFSLSYYPMYYSREARSYIFVILFSILSFGFCVKFLYGKRRIYAVAYILSSALLLYSHFFAVLVLAAQNIFYACMFFAGRKRVAPLGKWLLAQFAIGLLYLPLFLPAREILAGQMKRGLLLSGVNFGTLLRCILQMLHKGYSPLNIVISYSLCALVLLYIVRMLPKLIRRRDHTAGIKESDVFVMLIIWALLPALILFVISKVISPVLALRYVVTSVAPLAFMTASGIFVLPRKKMRTGALFLLLILYAVTYAHWSGEKHKARYTDIFSYIRQVRLMEDTPVFYNPGYLSMPILFNLSQGDFAEASARGSFFPYLQKRNVYLYEPKKVGDIIQDKRGKDFFVILGRTGRDGALNDIKMRKNIVKLECRDIYPSTVIHYLILKRKTIDGK